MKMKIAQFYLILLSTLVVFGISTNSIPSILAAGIVLVLYLYSKDKKELKTHSLNQEIEIPKQLEEEEDKPKERKKSLVNWSLEEAIKLGEIARDKYYDFKVVEDEVRRAQLQIAVKVKEKEVFEAAGFTDIGKASFDEYAEYINTIYLDRDPIRTAIEKRDVDKIIILSLIQVPKRMKLLANKESASDPNSRSIYFAIMHLQSALLHQVLEHAELINSVEQPFWKNYLLGSAADPLDVGEAMVNFLDQKEKGVKDPRFMKEIWCTLNRLLWMELTRSTGGKAEDAINILDDFYVSILGDYLGDNPEKVYESIKPLREEQNRVLGIDE